MRLTVNPGETVIVEINVEGVATPITFKVSSWTGSERSGAYVLAYGRDTEGRAGTVWDLIRVDGAQP